MLITGSSSEEMADFRTMLTSLEGKHVEDAPDKTCRKLHQHVTGKDALSTIDKLLKKLSKATKATKTHRSEQIKRAQQEQLDLIVLDMEVTDTDPLKLCQKIKETYQRFQAQNKAVSVKTPRFLALVGSQAKIAPNVMI
jgi:CheY-like chemotaxis protein